MKPTEKPPAFADARHCGDTAPVICDWTLEIDGQSTVGRNVEVQRLDADGRWRPIIDRPADMDRSAPDPPQQERRP